MRMVLVLTLSRRSAMAPPTRMEHALILTGLKPVAGDLVTNYLQRAVSILALQMGAHLDHV